MKIAVIGDIHGNIEALNSVMAEIGGLGADLVYCLGDLVDFGPCPGEVISAVERMGILSVRGNHDMALTDYVPGRFLFKSAEEQRYVEASLECTRRALTERDIDFIKGLPDRLELPLPGNTALFVHSFPSAYHYPGTDEAERFLDAGPWQYVFYGHSHKPALYTHNGKMAVNVGSVGKPRHGNAMASYCIAEFAGGRLTDLAFRYRPYDVEKVCRDIISRGFPRETIEILKGAVER
ncbi:MAG: metallophosphoesterase family protein [Bacillota bacterium]